MSANRFIEVIEDIRQRHAIDSVRRPGRETEYEFGRIRGVDHGLGLALAAILDIVKQDRLDNDKDRDERR